MQPLPAVRSHLTSCYMPVVDKLKAKQLIYHLLVGMQD